MGEKWQELDGRWERLRWSRLRAGYERAKDAAESLGIKPGTYRTYEYPIGEGGREPALSELQRIARKLKVNWVWLATGDGSPDEDLIAKERLAAAARKAGEIPADKQDDAWSAVMGVLDAFGRKAS
jgi:transcriptional regulator with XRE-family HTH domain